MIHFDGKVSELIQMDISNVHYQAALNIVEANNLNLNEYLGSILTLICINEDEETVVDFLTSHNIRYDSKVHKHISFYLPAETPQDELKRLLYLTLKNENFEATGDSDATNEINEHFDLFAMYWLLPKDVRAIIDKAGDDFENGSEDPYKILDWLMDNLAPLNYTFDCCLDGTPFALRKTLIKE